MTIDYSKWDRFDAISNSDCSNETGAESSSNESSEGAYDNEEEYDDSDSHEIASSEQSNLQIAVAVIVVVKQSLSFLGEHTLVITKRGPVALRVRIRRNERHQKVTEDGMRVFVSLSVCLIRTLLFLGIHDLLYYDRCQFVARLHLLDSVTSTTIELKRPCSPKRKVATVDIDVPSKRWAKALDRWAADEERLRKDSSEQEQDADACPLPSISSLPIPDLPPIPIGPVA